MHRRNLSLRAASTSFCIEVSEGLAVMRGECYVPHWLLVSKLGYPCRALLNIALLQFLTNHNMTHRRWSYTYSPFAVHLLLVHVGRPRVLQHFYPAPEQCPFKTTAPGPVWISQNCAPPSWVLDPSTHFPSTFVNARLLQVYKSPLPAIAFVRFISLPRRFILSSALTAFSILPFFY